MLPVDQIPADGGRHEGERLLAAGADLVAFGRPFLANPDLVERMRIGAPVNPLRDMHLYLGGETGYTDYPCWPPPHCSYRPAERLRRPRPPSAGRRSHR